MEEEASEKKEKLFRKRPKKEKEKRFLVLLVFLALQKSLEEV